MFGEWDDTEWCQFDNYMITNLRLYLNKGLLKSQFVNLKIRKLSAETCHEFIEWCGLIGNSPPNDYLKPNVRIFKQDLYEDFISENPDFAPKSKFTISRIKFWSWVRSYSIFKYGVEYTEGRNMSGRYVEFKTKEE